MPPDDKQLELDLSTADRGDNLDAVVDKDDGDELPLKKTEKEASPEPEKEKKGDSLDPTDEEGDETEEERAAREAEEAEERARQEKLEREKKIRIPKWRLDEVITKSKQREQALLERIQELESSTASGAREASIDKAQEGIRALQDKYEDLILDGDKEGARKVRAQLDKMRDDLYEYKARTASEHARQAAIDDLKYESTLASIESTYPELNPDLDDRYDQVKTDEVAMLMRAFQQNGMNRAAALQRAVKYVMGEAKSDDDVSRGTKNVDAEALRKKATEDARRRSADAARRQPTDTSRIPNNTGKAEPDAIDVTRLTQRSFAKLDEETKARLRGDEL